MTPPFFRGTAYQNVIVKCVAYSMSGIVLRALHTLFHLLYRTELRERYHYFVLTLKMSKLKKFRNFNNFPDSWCHFTCSQFCGVGIEVGYRRNVLALFYDDGGLSWGSLKSQDV